MFILNNLEAIDKFVMEAFLVIAFILVVVAAGLFGIYLAAILLREAVRFLLS